MRSPFSVAALVLFAAALLHAAEARQTLSLDGSWDFALDQKNPATHRISAAGGKVSGKIEVPGAWQAQGYGEETVALKHQWMGVATYSRQVPLPASFADTSEQRLFLVAERPQRSVQLFVGDNFNCNQTGYLSNLECEVTKHVHSRDSFGYLTNASLAIRLVVNSTRALGSDGLVGEEDLLSGDGENIGGWGGLGGHVRLEARSKEGWLLDPWIRHAVDDGFTTASVNASVELGGAESYTASGLSLRVALLDSHKKAVGQASAQCKAGSCSTDNIKVTSPTLWSPSSPVQYQAMLELVTASGKVVDQHVVTFGIRRLDVEGYHWKLNGDWLYLQGYGDDSVYPDTLAPPLTYSVYFSRLNFTKDLGMNWVRHHSHILPNEYFEVACDLGMMISAEFPLAYSGADGECPGKGCDAYYEQQWSATIRRLRNFPCVFDYTMDNEDNSLRIAKKLYNISKSLDPTRPVNTADGLFVESAAATEKLENPQDFRPVTFELLQIPIGDPHQFQITGTPPVPVTNHETGNFVIWPALDEQIAEFKGVLKPYWLAPARDHLQKVGLLGENKLWTYNSRQLYLFCWKNSMEALRKTEKISGYEWWLVQDYWMGSNGLVDTFFTPKLPASEIAEIKLLNAGLLLLVAEVGDNLPLPDKSPRLLRAYSSNGTLSTSLHVSNLHVAEVVGAKLSWKVYGISADGQRTDLCEGTVTTHAIPRIPGTTKLEAIECPLPDLGSFSHAPQEPMTVFVEGSLEDEHGKTLVENRWRSRIYAAAADDSSPKGNQVYTTPEFCQIVPINNMKCSIPPAGTKLPKGSVLVVSTLDETVLGFASKGATVLMIKGHGTAQFGGLPTNGAVFKTAWWLGGGAAGNNMGTVVYENSATITKGMAPDGWADEGWFNLVEGGQEFVLDEPLQGSTEILIRSIDLIGEVAPVKNLQENPLKVMSRNKALMWQSRLVPSNASEAEFSQGGAIIAVGLNLLVNNFVSAAQSVSVSSRGQSRRLASVKSTGAQVPEAAWFLHKLLQYAYSEPKPTKTLEAKITKCEGCVPSATWTLCPGNYIEAFV